MTKLTHQLLVFIVVLFCTMGYGQQRVQFSQYMVNQYILNPAVGGTDGDLDIAIGYRKQWANFKGSPVSYYVSGSAPIGVDRKPGRKKNVPIHAIGGIAFSDKTGPISKSTMMGSYSYNFPIYHDIRLAAGAFLGVTQVSLDYSEVSFDQEGEALNYTTVQVPDASFGFWIYNPQFFAGLSINQLFNQSIDFLDADDANGNLVNHYYLTSGYKIPLGVNNSSTNSHYLVPSIMLKYSGKTSLPSMDVNLKFHFFRDYWLGGSYRNLDSFILLAGVSLNANDAGIFNLAYSYDYTISKINRYTSGSHEVTLKYDFNMKPQTCPRAFW